MIAPPRKILGSHKCTKIMAPFGMSNYKRIDAYGIFVVHRRREKFLRGYLITINDIKSKTSPVAILHISYETGYGKCIAIREINAVS